MATRKTTPNKIETSVLRKSLRRCPLCFHLDHDSGEKSGQIAHLDQDPANYDEDNLAFLCLLHHSLYDSKTSQHKNYTAAEVKGWRDELYTELEHVRLAQSARMRSDTGQTPNVQRRRDLDTLTSALSLIHWPTLDEHVSELPYVIIEPVFHFYEGFHALYTSSLFHLYDPVLAQEMAALHSAWDITVSFGIHYRDLPNGKYVFDNPKDRLFSDKQERDWKKIQQAAMGLASAKQALLSHIRKHYIEIDINELSSKAWKDFWKYRNRPLD